MKYKDTLRFYNDYIGCENFVPLGQYDYGVLSNGVSTSCRFDLYALPYHGGARRTITFGARFSNQPEDYRSGEAYLKDDGEWVFCVGKEVAVAAARFFANCREYI